MSATDRTFYCDEDMERLYFRTDQWTLPEARHEAAAEAREWVDPSFRTRFRGKRKVLLSDTCEAGCTGHHGTGVDGAVSCFVEREAWDFEVYEP